MYRAAISTLLLITLVSAKCPNDADVSPCMCVPGGFPDLRPSLYCKTNQPIDLAKITKTLRGSATSVPTYYVVSIENNPITEIKADDLSLININSLRIYNCTQLTKIDVNALHSRETISELQLIENDKLPESEELNLFNQLPNVYSSYLMDLDQISPSSFPNSKYGNEVFLGGKRLKSIQSKSFANFTGMFMRFTITGSSLDSLPADAFLVKGNGDTVLVSITFRNNSRLTGASFSKNTFRVTESEQKNIDISITFDPVPTYLNEEAFRPVLDAKYGGIQILSGKLACTDKRNLYLNNYRDRVNGYNC